MSVALVTGGSRGIGQAIALRLHKAGFAVAITGTRTPEQTDLSAFEDCEAIEYMQSDIANPASREETVSYLLAKYGAIEILVNNAGIAPRTRADLLQTSAESYHEVMSVNLEGPFFLTQHIAREMEKNQKGVIVNIASVSSDTVSINRGEYCLSKAGMSMMTQLFAARLADCGVRVYEVRPGIIRTDMTAGVVEKYDRLIADGLQPIARWGRPEDVAEAVCLLCEGRLPFSTGEVLHVDGGMHIRRL